jgi:hypothetical protein
MNDREQARQSVLRRALEKIDALEARLAQAGPAAGPIAVIGIGCRFPGGADGPAAFWRLLRDGFDATGPIPVDRWDADAFYAADPEAPGKTNARRGAFLGGVDMFDPGVFGIAPREAAALDPQQRILLEVAWEALEHAGLPPAAARRNARGRLHRRRHERIRAPAARVRHRGHRLASPLGHAREFRGRAHRLLPRPERAGHGARHGLLLVAHGGARGLPEPARRRLRLARPAAST